MVTAPTKINNVILIHLAKDNVYMIGNSIIAATGVATGATTSAPGVTPPSNTGKNIESEHS